MENLLNKLRAFKSQYLKALDKKKILIIIAISLVIIYIDFAFLVKAQIKKIKQVAPQVAKLKSDINALTKDLANMQELKRKQNEMKQKEESGAKKIISETQIPLFLQDISDIANSNKVKIMQIKPAKEGLAEFGGKFTPLTITLDLSCDYHQLGAFLNKLETASGFMIVQNMKISRDPSNYFLQNINLVLKTYVKK